MNLRHRCENSRKNVPISSVPSRSGKEVCRSWSPRILSVLSSFASVVIRRSEPLRSRLFFYDSLIICICWIAAYYIRFSGVIHPVTKGMQPLAPYLWFLMPIVIAWAASALTFDLYAARRGSSHMAKFIDVAKANVLSVLVVSSLMFFIRGFEYSRAVVAYFWLFSLLFLGCSRVTFPEDLRLLRDRGKEWILKITPVLPDFKKAFVNLALLATTTVILLLIFEGILRMWPEMFGQLFANTVLTKYNMTPEGIFYHDPVLKMNFMKPNFTTENYWNGYHWHHETDEFGFRNSSPRNQADVLLIGDSLIYGHGVDIDETVGVLLEREVSYSVLNLGVQGYCAFQEAYLVTEYVPKFKPRYVFFFFFENDIADLYPLLTDQEMNEFVHRNISEISYAPRMDPNKLIRQSSLSGSWRPQFYLPYAKNVLEYELHHKLKKGQNKPAPPDKLHDPNDEDSLAWQYTKKAILYMDAVVKSHHAEFIIVPITILNKHYYDILKKFSAQYQLSFLEDAKVYEWGWNSDYFLPNDGHFTKKGAEAMAKLIAKYVKSGPS